MLGLKEQPRPSEKKEYDSYGAGWRAARRRAIDVIRESGIDLETRRQLERAMRAVLDGDDSHHGAYMADHMVTVVIPPRSEYVVHPVRPLPK